MAELMNLVFIVSSFDRFKARYVAPVKCLRLLYTNRQSIGDAQCHVIAVLQLIEINIRSHLDRRLTAHRTFNCHCPCLRVDGNNLTSDLSRLGHDYARHCSLWRDCNEIASARAWRCARLAYSDRHRFQQRGLDGVAYLDLVKVTDVFA